MPRPHPEGAAPELTPLQELLQFRDMEEVRFELRRRIYQEVQEDNIFPPGYDLVAHFMLGLVVGERGSNQYLVPPLTAEGVARSGLLRILRVPKKALDLQPLLEERLNSSLTERPFVVVGFREY